jgi:hypothetical protein
VTEKNANFRTTPNPSTHQQGGLSGPKEFKSKMPPPLVLVGAELPRQFGWAARLPETMKGVLVLRPGE